MPIIRWGHETEIIDIDWCWKPYLPYGKVSIIEGDGGDGKTTMILTVAALLSQGIQPPALERGHLLPSQPCTPITTFYLTNEDEVADSSLKRFIKAGGVTERFAYSGELQQPLALKKASGRRRHREQERNWARSLIMRTESPFGRCRRETHKPLKPGTTVQGGQVDRWTPFSGQLCVYRPSQFPGQEYAPRPFSSPHTVGIHNAAKGTSYQP